MADLYIEKADGKEGSGNAEELLWQCSFSAPWPPIPLVLVASESSWCNHDERPAYVSLQRLAKNSPPPSVMRTSGRTLRAVMAACHALMAPMTSSLLPVFSPARYV